MYIHTGHFPRYPSFLEAFVETAAPAERTADILFAQKPLP